MAQRTNRRISYMLPLSDATGGHRLGINGLAYDRKRSILYSAGRDGLIYAWNVCDAIKLTTENKHSNGAHYRQHVQAHSHWINDIALVKSDIALVSASSDTSVKLYSPHTQEDGKAPSILGLHDDYVKCLASPGAHADWIVAGGLDKKLSLWDLHGGGERLKINVTGDDDDISFKGSVYAVGANESLIASGGPDKVVKIWDLKSGKRVTKFVGHTDNVRCILLASDGDVVMTGSSDQTVKLWSLNAGRCMYTLNMHNDSVWCLYSDHPQLSVFFSGDRAGFVAKSDTRGAVDLDDGLSIAICQEKRSVNKIVCADKSIWTATSDSTIRHWLDVDTNIGIQLPGNTKPHRSVLPQRQSALHVSQMNFQTSIGIVEPRRIPVNCVLRMSNAKTFSTRARSQVERGPGPLHGLRHTISSSIPRSDIGPFIPLRVAPIETISGQSGLVSHVLLNNRRHVLAIDLEGFVTMWDILECKKVASLGKRPLEDVLSETNTKDAVANWCTVDTRTGTLNCVLEERRCFEAEVYADEVEIIRASNFKEDQRINLGKWVLRYLFEGLLKEEIRRDEALRDYLFNERKHSGLETDLSPEQAVELYSSSGSQVQVSLRTPGLSVGIATPSAGLTTPILSTKQQDASAMKADKGVDYFSLKSTIPEDNLEGESQQTELTSMQTSLPGSPCLGPGKEKSHSFIKESSSLFSKRIRMPFSNRRDPKSSLLQEVAKQISRDQVDNPRTADGKIYEDTLRGVLEQIKSEYHAKMIESNHLLETLITPPDNQETPLINPSNLTTILIQEEREGPWAVTDLFDSMLVDIERKTNMLESALPAWVGNFLLRNRIPSKDVVKVTFLLEPYGGLLPPISTEDDGTERLNANRMLRARKISTYVIEKLHESVNLHVAKNLKPEDCIELYCQNQVRDLRMHMNKFRNNAHQMMQLVPPRMTLASIRMHLWRSSGDLILAYKLGSIDKSGII